MPVLSEGLFEVFGGGSWVFLPAAPVHVVAAALRADVVSDGHPWGENPHVGEGASVLVLTAPINGWMLLQGASETVGGAAATLSERQPVFRATIDVRLPTMSWAYLDGGMPMRTVSVELGDEGDLVTRTAGDPLPFESEHLVCPTSEYGYDSYFYPVAILGHHGLGLGSLEEALLRPSVTLRLP